jgi:signal transduction histidine kinase
MKRIGYLILLIVCLVLVLLAVFLLLFPTRKNAMVSVSTKQADKVVATEKSSTNDSSQNTENTEIIELISALNNRIINLTQQVDNKDKDVPTKTLKKIQFNLVAGQRNVSILGIQNIFEVDLEGIGLNPELDYTVDGSYLHLNIEPDTGDFLTIKYQ